MINFLASVIFEDFGLHLQKLMTFVLNAYFFLQKIFMVSALIGKVENVVFLSVHF